MNIIFAALGIWVIASLSIYSFIRRSERRDPEGKGPGIIAVTSALLALPVAAVMGGILFALAGSVQVVGWLFDLELSPGKVGIFAIAVLVYLFSADSLIELFLKSVMGKSAAGKWVLLFTRVLAFYGIGLLVGAEDQTALPVAAGLAVMLLVMEVLFHLLKKSGEGSVRKGRR
ncbi:hypothetical protein [Bhargavaea beijingensis]|uniref:Uncharacterized protein n=1 Tax=Bhargavaea beijingensis TaxID=426756 RepID=A0ABX9ZEU9_9BACL|nr:hypothetical protein [Bhargavaea beijingensis]MCW1927295.1 hypothetical protein [Bhargavaea beijingensis]RSK35578.1 hypothetical protein EJA12_03115 [Bhargavaea beijingensis]